MKGRLKKGMRQIVSCVLSALLVCAMPMVLAFAADGVEYLSPTVGDDGTVSFSTETTTSAEAITDTTTALGEDDSNEHWYVVNGAVEITTRITVTGDVHLILADGATLNASAGITVEGSNSLTIYAQSTGDDMGKLVATATSVGKSTGSSAGIGGTAGSNAGTITINGGNITATGGSSTGEYVGTGAGIGGGGSYNSTAGSGGTIIINGGTVAATGGAVRYASGSGAGIGGGGSYNSTAGDGGKITIAGGTVIAKGGDSATYYDSGTAYIGTGAGIGGGGSSASGTAGDGGTIIIDSGDITATGGTAAGNDSGTGAGIGGGGARGDSGGAGDGGDITINDGNIIATGGTASSSSSGTGAGIGGGGVANYIAGAGGTIAINGGDITANGGEASNNPSGTGAGIGGGGSYSGTAGSGGEVTIEDGGITATGGTASSSSTGTGAGIGGGGSYSGTAGSGGEVTIEDGDINAAGGTDSSDSSGTGAGIGGGGAYSGTVGSGGAVIIDGGTITAMGGSGAYCGAGIGSGRKYSAELPISGTVILATTMGYTASADSSEAMLTAGKGTGEADSVLPAYPYVEVQTYVAKYLNPTTDSTSSGVISWELKDVPTGYTEINGNYSDTAWSAGWYVVTSDATIAQAIVVNGEVSLVLESGTTLNASGGITLNSDSSLTIYVQSTDNTLSELVVGGINGSGDVTINGGTITATGQSNANGISANALTVNAGAIIAVGDGTSAGITCNTATATSTILYGTSSTSLADITTLSEVSTTGLSSEKYAILVYSIACYLDENGDNQLAVNPTAVTDNTTEWSTGWYVVDGEYTISSRITVTGDVYLILADDAVLTANAGITVEEGNSLTIYTQSEGTGQLVATAGSSTRNAGIGGTEDTSAGTITINGGVITATGGYNGYYNYGTGAGIGGGGSNSGTAGSGGTIIINGGTITATGGANAASGAGIGGGGSSSGTAGSGGIITINGGTITATGGASGNSGAGIGGGGSYYGTAGSGGTIVINNGTVTAAGGAAGGYTGTGAGIGGGSASGNNTSAGIPGAGGDITINGGVVIATGGAVSSTRSGTGAGIGGGGTYAGTDGAGSGGTVTITGGEVTATGGAASDAYSGSGAGIGGGGAYYTAAGDGGTVSVRDATVTVTGGAASNSYSGSGAGIGGGGSYNNTGGSGGNVTINSGTVTASGGSGSWSGAGIGSGRKYNTTLSVSGTVTIASSMGYGTSTTSVAEITAYTISTGAELSDFSTNQYAKAQVIALDWSIAINQTFADGASSYTYGDVISLTATVTETIDTDAVLTYQWYSCDSAESSGTMITDATKDTLTLSSLNASTYYYYCVVSRTSDDITVIVTSDIETVTINVKALADSMIAAIDDQPYTGSAITPTITVSDGDPSIITENDYSVAYNTNTNVGTATVTITATDGGNYTGTASANFTIVQSSTSFGDDDLTVDDDVTDNTYTYGDTVSITITPEATGEAAVQTNDMIASRALFSLDAADADQTSLYDTAPTTDQMALYATIDDVETQLCEPVDVSDDDGSYTLTYDTTDKLLAVGTHTITAKYVGNDNMADYSETFEITIVAKSVTAQVITNPITKEYDTDTTATVAWEIAADGLAVATDEITVTAIATYASADVADGIAIDFSDLATGGAQMSYYNVSLPTNITGNITTRTVTSDDITITLDTTSYTYNGTAKTPSVSIVDNTYGNTIDAGEYTISYSSNTSVGTATVTITDVDGGNYDVSGSTTFTIAAASTSTATVTEWYIVTLSTNGGGTLAPELGCFEIVAMQEGTSYTFSITPYSGYAISAVYVDGTNIGAVSEYTIDSLNSNRSIHVDFVSASVSADAEDATDEVEEDTVDVPEDTTVATEADDVADSVSTEDADDVDASTDEEETTEAAVSESDRKSGSTLPIVGGIVAAVAVLGGIGYFLFKRKNGFDGED